MNSIERQILKIIGESATSPDVFTDTDAGIEPIRDSVSDAIQELCMVSGSYRRTYFLSLLESRQFYRLAPKNDYIVAISSVYDRQNRRKLDQTDPTTLSRDDPQWLDSEGYPLQWMLIGPDIFGVYYIPSSKGQVLELECLCVPKPYTRDGDEIRLRALHQRAAIQLSASEFFASRGDAERAKLHLQQYLELAGLTGLHPSQPERVYDQWGRNDVSGRS